MDNLAVLIDARSRHSTRTSDELIKKGIGILSRREQLRPGERA